MWLQLVRDAVTLDMAVQMQRIALSVMACARPAPARVRIGLDSRREAPELPVRRPAIG